MHCSCASHGENVESCDSRRQPAPQKWTRDEPERDAAENVPVADPFDDNILPFIFGEKSVCEVSCCKLDAFSIPRKLVNQTSFQEIDCSRRKVCNPGKDNTFPDGTKTVDTRTKHVNDQANICRFGSFGSTRHSMRMNRTFSPNFAWTSASDPNFSTKPSPILRPKSTCSRVGRRCWEHPTVFDDPLDAQREALTKPTWKRSLKNTTLAEECFDEPQTWVRGLA